MKHSAPKLEHSVLKLSFGIIGAVILLVALGWGGYRVYANWEEKHLVRRASAYMEGGGYRLAVLSASRALQLNPRSAGAARIIAQAGENSGDHAALDWRRKVVELAPGSREDALALALCAIRFNDIPLAEKTLTALDYETRQTAAFQAAAARLAEAKKEQAKAEGYWAEALKIEPGNKTFQLHLATARLRSDDSSRRDWAKKTLEGLRADPEQRVTATRELINDGVVRHESVETLRDWARALQNYPEAEFRDRLLYMDILHQMKDPEFTSYLTKIENDAVSKPTDLAALLSWMGGAGLSTVAIDFSHSLPAEKLKTWPVPLGVTECYAKRNDWRGVEQLTKNERWPQLDFIRRAYLARALRGLGKTGAAEKEWAGAEQDAGADARFVDLLTRTISGWGWTSETVDLLWRLARSSEKQLEALHSLYRYYSKESDTQGLYRVLVRLSEIEPGNLDVQNNLAQISLLLNADVDHARKLAADVYRSNSSNPAYAATYAYSLYARGDVKQALKVMDSLTPEQLKQPAVGTYYGIFLARAGEHDRASEFLALADHASLLTEEKALVDSAKRRIQVREPSGG